jgi:hypothetical protein
MDTVTMYNGQGVALIITSLATLITAIGGIIVSLLNAKKLEEVHKSTNGKMEELVAVVKKASFAEGAKSEADKSKHD